MKLIQQSWSSALTAAPVLRHGVPLPLVFEAPSSWLSRLALAQGCTVTDVWRFLNLTPTKTRDPDRCIQGEKLSALRQRCNLPATAFAAAAHVMDLFSRVTSNRESLLADVGGWARFRYCPLCFSEQPTAHLNIHWRYTDWRHCLLHSCTMEDQCEKCGSWLGYPRDMVTSRAGRSGHASQKRCLKCSADLSKVTPRRLDLRRPGVLTDLELCWLLNGGALLAGLNRGHLSYSDRERAPQHDRTNRPDWFPDRSQWLDVKMRILLGQRASDDTK